VDGGSFLPVSSESVRSNVTCAPVGSAAVAVSTTGVTILGSNLAGEERVLVDLLEVMLADG
jgi:hypothetical protein